MRRTRQWTEQIVIDELRHLLQRGVPLTNRGLVEAGESRLLHVVNHFGGLPRARRLAGVAPTRTSRSKSRLDPEDVLREIQRRERENEPLASSRVPPPLHYAAQRHFGSWRAAIEAAGLEYEKICLRPLASDEELIDRLQSLVQVRPQMTWTELRREPLASSLRSRFGSLAQALLRAEIDAWPTGPPRARTRPR